MVCAAHAPLILSRKVSADIVTVSSAGGVTGSAGEHPAAANTAASNVHSGASMSACVQDLTLDDVDT